MARPKGTFNLSANIETNAAAPLDSRDKVATLADLTASGSFPYFYEGMQVYVTSEHERYTLVGNDPTIMDNWVKNRTIVDNAISSTSENPVQNKVIKSALDNKQEIIQVSTMPSASGDYVGKLYQYTGTTDSSFTYGYFYKCIENTSTSPSTYSWANVKVQDGTISMDLTQDEYSALPSKQKLDGTVYYVMDSVPAESGLAVCGFTPVGTIISVMGNTAPKNYLACKGQIVNVLDYPELAAYFEAQFGRASYFGGNGTTTFGIPDLRGEFLRGTGTKDNGKGNGSSVGTHQDGTELPYGAMTIGSSLTRGMWSRFDDSWKSADNNYTNAFKNMDYHYGGTNKKVMSVSTTNSPADASNDYVSIGIRPTNTSVLYCIATKDIYITPENNYSTNEQVVGTWIDGKPLYQKTYVLTAPTVVTDGTAVVEYTAHDIANIDIICLNNVFLIDTNGIARILPYLLNSGNQIKISVGKTSFQFVSAIKDYNNCNTYATIQYTKTTD